jgi:hypothetical protein
MYDLESVVCITILESFLFGKTEMSHTQGIFEFLPLSLSARVVTYSHRCCRQGLPEALGYFLCRHRSQEVSRTAHQINNSEAVYKRPPAYKDASQHQAQDELTPMSGRTVSGMRRLAVRLSAFWRNISLSSV